MGGAKEEVIEERGDGGEEVRVGDEHAEVALDRGGQARLEHGGAELVRLHRVELQDQRFHNGSVYWPFS